MKPASTSTGYHTFCAQHGAVFFCIPERIQRALQFFAAELMRGFNPPAHEHLVRIMAMMVMMVRMFMAVFMFVLMLMLVCVLMFMFVCAMAAANRAYIVFRFGFRRKLCSAEASVSLRSIAARICAPSSWLHGVVTITAEGYAPAVKLR